MFRSISTGPRPRPRPRQMGSVPIQHQSQCHPIDIHCNLLSTAIGITFAQESRVKQCKHTITCTRSGVFTLPDTDTDTDTDKMGLQPN